MEDGIRRLSRSRRPVLVSVVIMALLLGAVLVACRSSVRRLDEAMLYEGPAFKLKVVRYHQRLPFSYDGAIAEMQCSSDKTRDVTEGTSNDPGWVSVEYVPALG